MSLAALLLPLCAAFSAVPDMQPVEAEVLRVAQAPKGSSSAGELSTKGSPGNGYSNQNSNPYARMARVPNMFGDSLSPMGILSFGDNNPNISVGPQTNLADTEIPLGGGGGRYLPIGENNKPIPMDRVFFIFNGFQNAVTTYDPGLNGNVDQDLNRYTFGFEKTFQEGLSSLEIRFPLANSLNSNTPFFTSDTGNVGNLNLVLKHLIYQNEAFAVALGMGIALPTGSDVTGTLGPDPFRVSNDAVYLLPYLGATFSQDNYFVTSFMQIDVAASGDELTVSGIGSAGRLTAPTFARFDIALGYWLLDNMNYQYLDGVALVSELHYVTTLSDGDVLQPYGPGSFNFGYSENRIDYLNFTAGVHCQLTELSNVRISGVFPIKNDPDRQFDSEIQVSFNRNF
jgi:hypothetical protein